MRSLVARAGLEGLVEVESAGTAGYHAGEPADARAIAAGRARGVELAGRARQFVAEDFARFDLVLAMDRSNLDDLVDLAPDDEARGKVRLLRSFDASSPRGASVPDPYYGGDEGFAEVVDICERACVGLLDHLRSRLGR